MKQELLCKECSEKCKRINPAGNPYPGEHVKYVDGTIKKDGDIHRWVCDWCGIDIMPGDPATCQSIWSDYGGVPYSPWEHEYITENPS